MNTEETYMDIGKTWWVGVCFLLVTEVKVRVCITSGCGITVISCFNNYINGRF